jgi:uncharacterized OB-fold protein
MVELPAVGAVQQFKSYLAEGRFMIQRSRSTGQYTFYPRLLIPGSGETDLEWVEASGLGTIYSITVSRRRDGDYNIALVDLDEGVRMMSTINGVVEAPIGARVKASIAQLEGERAVVFNLCDDEVVP